MIDLLTENVPSPVSTSTVSALSALDSMWARIDTARAALQEDYVQERPAGAFTLAEYCQRFNLPESTGRGQLTRLKRNGVLKRYRTTTQDSLGRSLVQNIYLLVEQGTNQSFSKSAG